MPRHSRATLRAAKRYQRCCPYPLSLREAIDLVLSGRSPATDAD